MIVPTTGRPIGYARTSSVEQDARLRAQLQNLKAAGCEHVFSDKVSSIVPIRLGLEEAIAFARKGDMLVVTKLDRLARSVADLLAIIERLEAKGVGLRITSMAGHDMNTFTPPGQLMLTIFSAIVEFDRVLTLERQRESFAKTKLDRDRRGRPPTALCQANEVKHLKAKGVRPVDIARQLKIGRASVYRILGKEVI